MRHHSSFAARLTLLGVAAITSLLHVQLAEAQAATTRKVTDLLPAGSTTQAGEIKNAIVVHESAIVREIFSNAEKRDALKDWSGAADLYQKLLANFADQLVPVSVDKNGIAVRYTSVARAVLERLCRWPREGLDAYCRINEPKAAALLEQARKSAAAGQDGSAALDEVLRLYFVTESAKAAALRLMDEKFDRGEFFAAAWLGDKLLNLHPNLAAERPAVLFQTALAYRLAGDAKAAGEGAATLAGKFPNESGVVRGKMLALALGQGVPKPPITGTTPDSWPMMGGTMQRDGVPAGHPNSGVRIASIPLAPADYRGLTRPQETMLRQQIDAIAEGGATLGIMPAVDRGELFFQDGMRVYAVSLDSGDPLPGWVRTWGADRQGRYVLPDVWGSTRAHQQAITLTDQQVLAVMGQPDNSVMQFGVAARGTARLVCLDRESGKENWVIAPSTMKDVPRNDEENAVRALQFSGSPLVVGDNVLAIGRSNKQGQGDDCYVLAFDLSNGHYRWGCYIASSGRGMNAMWGGMPVMTSGDRTSQLAYADGRVYVLTNLGAVAALDARDGRIVWLDIYPADEMPPHPELFNFRRELRDRIKPWMVNPVVVHDGKIFALPADGDSLLIYDSASGREEKRINLEQLAHWDLKISEQPDRPTTLIGVMGERLLLAGESRVLCLDWRKYDEQKFPGPNDEMILWPSVSPFGIRGRCFATSDTLIVPGQDRLRWIDMKTGAAVDEYPRYSRPWADGESAGNVVVSGNRTIIAGVSSVNIYADLALVTAELDREIAGAPNAPGPRLRYAEVMDASGRIDEALSRLNEAEKLIEGETAPPGPGSDRDRLFNDAMACAARSAGDKSPEALKRVGAFFDLAAQSAFSPQQQVDYRIARARYYGPGYPGDAVKLYQEILADRQMRAISLPGARDDELERSLASDVAEMAIDDLIRANGPEVYAAFQKAADRDLLAARKLQDHPVQMAGMLLWTAHTYPNSTAARHVMVAAADAYERAGEPRQAIRVLRQTWFDYSLQGTTPVAIAEGIARNYLAVSDGSRLEMVSAAAERLALAASLPGEPKLSQDMKLPDGRVLPAGTPFAKALDAIRGICSNDPGVPLPDIRLPVLPSVDQKLAGARIPAPFLGQDPKHRQVIPPDAAVVLPGVTTLIAPERESARVDRVVAWGAGAVAIFPAGRSTPSFSVKAFPDAGHGSADAPVGVAWTGDTALVWGHSRLVAIDASAAGNGNKLWDIDIARIAEVRLVGERVLVSTSAGELQALDIDSGRLAWQRSLGQRPFERLLATQDFIVAKFSDDIACRLVAMDTYTGRVLGTKAFAVQVIDPLPHVGMVPVNLALSAGGTLVYTMPDRLCIKDLYRPWDDEEKVAAAQPVQAIYVGANRPGQLVISAGRVLAVADHAPAGQRADEKWVRVHSLDTGEPVLLSYDAADGSHGKIDLVMTAQTNDWNVFLRLVGPHVYLIGPHSVCAYNLQKPGDIWHWNSVEPTDKNDPATDAFCGQQHLVTLEPSLGPPFLANSDPTEVRLIAYSRRPARENDPNSGESGHLDYIVTLTDPTGIQPACWQACDGGFYYATDDGKVHMLRGAQETPARR